MNQIYCSSIITIQNWIQYYVKVVVHLQIVTAGKYSIKHYQPPGTVLQHSIVKIL